MLVEPWKEPKVKENNLPSLLFSHGIEFLNIIVRICILLPLSYMLHSISPNNTPAYELQTPACSPWPEFLLSNTAHRYPQHGPRSHLIFFMAPPSPGCWCLVLIHFCLFEFLTHCLILISGHFETITPPLVAALILASYFPYLLREVPPHHDFSNMASNNLVDQWDYSSVLSISSSILGNCCLLTGLQTSTLCRICHLKPSPMAFQGLLLCTWLSGFLLTWIPLWLLVVLPSFAASGTISCLPSGKDCCFLGVFWRGLFFFPLISSAMSFLRNKPSIFIQQTSHRNILYSWEIF